MCSNHSLVEQGMEDRLAHLLPLLKTPPIDTSVLQQITNILQVQTVESLPACLVRSFEPLLVLHQWSWQLFSDDVHSWINELAYCELFHTIASFDKELVFDGSIEVEDKAPLLFCATIDQVDRVFAQIEQRMADDENDPFLGIINRWLSNHSYLIFDQLQYTITPLVDHIGQHIARHYIMSRQYKLYLAALRHVPVSDASFTTRMLFYVKICSFYTYTCLMSNGHHPPYTSHELISHLAEDYLQIVHVQCPSVAAWHPELASCIGHLTAFIVLCCWRDGQVETRLKQIFATEQAACDHVRDLMQLLAHRAFYADVHADRDNGPTVLLHACVMFSIVVVTGQNVSWFFHSNPNMRETLVCLAETVRNEQICLSAYHVLGETLTDEQLKHLAVADHISSYCFQLLEECWYRPWKKFKKVPIEPILRGRPANHRSGTSNVILQVSNRSPRQTRCNRKRLH